MLKNCTWYFFIVGFLPLWIGCGGPRAFTKGEYDDPTRVELLDDKFNESDMQKLADTVVQSLSQCRAVMVAEKPPFVILEGIANRTQEHIDMKAVQEKIQTALIRSDKLSFINKQERDRLQDEYQYNESGAVSGATKKSRGKQIGADYILSGALSTNVQQVGSDKFIYYKLTVNLTNLETSAISCSVEKEIRKYFEKKRISF